MNTAFQILMIAIGRALRIVTQHNFQDNELMTIIVEYGIGGIDPSLDFDSGRYSTLKKRLKSPEFSQCIPEDITIPNRGTSFGFRRGNQNLPHDAHKQLKVEVEGTLNQN